MINLAKPRNLTNGFHHYAFDEVSSTNSTCLEIAQSQNVGSIWVTTNSQTAGRGSRGRDWQSMDGNLFASLLLKDIAPNEVVSTLTFVSCLAVRDALHQLSDGKIPVTLKWPNDVLMAGKKICGILLENHLVKGAQFIIIGIGINVKDHPELALYPATSLYEQGLETNIDSVFDRLANAMAKRLEQWNRGAGFTSIREDWLKQADRLGQEIVAKQKETEIKGIFEGISEDGRLIIQPENSQKQLISVADIFFS